MPIAKRANRHMVFKKSWTSNVMPILIALSLMAAAIKIYSLNIYTSIALVFSAIALCIYSVLINRSTTIYTDDNGVWLYSGIFPWSKGITGVKWRDLDEALFYQGFFGWIFKSYTIRIGHRFTKKSEITISHVNHGHIASQRINEILQSKASLN
ncbi:MAG: hypothetical protein ACREXR_01985 [Gammaproteobacteria bacterium]